MPLPRTTVDMECTINIVVSTYVELTSLTSGNLADDGKQLMTGRRLEAVVSDETAAVLVVGVAARFTC